MSAPISSQKPTLPWKFSDYTPTSGNLTVPQSTTTPKLFTPTTIGGLTLKNRFVVSPMCMYSATDGYLSDFHLAHLGQYAFGGASLIIQEATAIVPEGRISPYCPGLWEDAQIEKSKQVTKLIHDMGSLAGIQLNHAGRKASGLPLFIDKSLYKNRFYASASEGGWPEKIVGSSHVPWDANHPVPHEMTLEEIKQSIEDWKSATRRALDAGYDFIEIHGAHGYLVSAFLSPNSNRRTDEYGGSFNNRIRYLLEVAKALREIIPKEKALAVRISCNEWLDETETSNTVSNNYSATGNKATTVLSADASYDSTTKGWTNRDSVELVRHLIDLGVDLIDCSSGGMSAEQKIKVWPGHQVPFADEIKTNYLKKIHVGAVGLLTTGPQCEAVLQANQADVIIVARQFLRDPYFPIRAGDELGYDVTSLPQYARSSIKRA